mgnify:CR=1 FL=1
MESLNNIMNEKTTLNLGNIESKRDFTFVSDTARGMLNALVAENIDGETINVGSNANDGTGDTLRDAMIKVNEMFTEVYSSPGISSETLTFSGNEIQATRSNDDLVFKPSGTGDVVFPALRFNGNNIEGIRTNENINLTPSGTGKVVFGSIGISGTSLTSDDSSSININEGLIAHWKLNLSLIHI